MKTTKIIVAVLLLGTVLFNTSPNQINAVDELKCGYYIDSANAYKDPTPEDAAIAEADKLVGVQLPYLLSQGYRIGFWGGSMTTNCTIDLTNVTVNGGSIFMNGPGQNITVIGNGDDVFGGRLYMEAGNFVFKDIKFKRTVLTPDDPGITVNINENGGPGNSSYYFDEKTEIITGEYYASSQTRQALQVGGIRSNSKVIFDGNIKMEHDGIGITTFNASNQTGVLDNSLVQFNGTLEMGPKAWAGFYLSSKISNLVLGEQSKIINTTSEAPVFTLQSDTTMNRLDILGSIQSNAVLREGAMTSGSINEINFKGAITAGIPSITNLSAIFLEQLNIGTVNFSDTFSISNEFSYLLKKSPTKGNSTIQNVNFSAGSTVNADTALLVGKGVIDNVVFNGNKGTKTVLEVESGARVGVATLDNMNYQKADAVIVNNRGTINTLNIGQNSVNNQFTVQRLIRNSGAGAHIDASNIQAFVVSDPTLFEDIASNPTAYSIENSVDSATQMQNTSLTNTFLFGPTIGLNNGTVLNEQIQPTGMDVSVIEQVFGSMTISVEVLGVPTSAISTLDLVILDDQKQPVSTLFKAQEEVTFNVEQGKTYYVANYAHIDDVNHLVYSSIAKPFMTPNAYTVTFIVPDQEPINQSYLTGDLITAPSLPDKTGYAFEGWNESPAGTKESWDFTNDVMPEHNLELYAKYTPNSYTITFDANGGVGSMLTETYQYEQTKALDKNSYVREGYTFSGWATSRDGDVVYLDQQEIQYTTVGNMVLYAKYTPNNYTVTFDANGGVGSMLTETYQYEQTKALDKNSYVREGYTFSGWATSRDGEVVYLDQQEIQYTTVGNMVLYAKYTPNNYTVTFDANGGVGSMLTETYQYEQTKALDKNSYVREGYTFSGWATSKDGDVVYLDQQEIQYTTVGNMVLYAKWAQKSIVPVVVEPVVTEPQKNLPATGQGNEMVMVALLTMSLGLILLMVKKSKKDQQTAE